MFSRLSTGLLLAASCASAIAAPLPEPASDDLLSIVPANALPGGIPAKFQGSARQQAVTRDADGISLVGEDAGLAQGIERTVAAIKRIRAQMKTRGIASAIRDERLPGLVFDLDEIPLTRPAIHVPSGMLLGAKPAGTRLDAHWTGLTRYYRLADGALMELTETDLAAVQGRLYLVPEAINTEIHGKPGMAAVLKNAEGRRVRQVIWVSGPKSYELNVLEPADTPSTAEAARQADNTPPAARSVSAIALARALKQPRDALTR